MKTLKLFLINTVIILICIFCLEISLNYLFAEQNFNQVRKIRLKEHKPNLNLNVSLYKQYLERVNSYNKEPILENKNYRLRTDNEGYIIGDDDGLNDYKSVDAIFYGGSTTECLYVNESKRFPYLVQKTLNDSLKLNLKFLNAGVSGKSSIESSFDLLSRGIPLNPKFVFLMHNINDLALLIKSGSYWNAPITRSIIIKSDSNKKFIELAFPNTIKFFIKIKNLIFTSLIKEVDEWLDFENDIKDIPDNEILSQYKNSLNNFILLAENYNIKVVLMTQANRFSPDDQLIYENTNYSQRNIDIERMMKLYKKFNNIVREISKTKKLDLIDLDSLTLEKDKYIYDEVHFNSKGSENAAKIISDFMINNYYK